MNYPGGKGSAGTVQRIINQVPAHDTYVEPFAGGGAVWRAIRPAARALLVDLDLRALAALDLASADLARPAGDTYFVRADAVEFLASFPWTGREFVYADPPYLLETRRSKRRLYRNEFGEAAQHAALLNVLREVPTAVMISGYRSELYAQQLKGWRRVDFRSQTRQGSAEESLWMNYPQPDLLHDYRFLGDDFRERERIGRKAKRWAKGLRKMPDNERRAVLSAIFETVCGDLTSPEVAMLQERVLRSGIDRTGDARA